jgi:hypothetical protein
MLQKFSIGYNMEKRKDTKSRESILEKNLRRTANNQGKGKVLSEEVAKYLLSLGKVKLSIC